jgi:hypothetical protein
MKKQIKNLILFLILAFSSNASFCYTLTSAELKQDVLNKITPDIKAQVAPYSSDFKISITGISQNPIITDESITGFLSLGESMSEAEKANRYYAE